MTRIGILTILTVSTRLSVLSRISTFTRIGMLAFYAVPGWSLFLSLIGLVTRKGIASILTVLSPAPKNPCYIRMRIVLDKRGYG